MEWLRELPSKPIPFSIYYPFQLTVASVANRCRFCRAYTSASMKTLTVTANRIMPDTRNKVCVFIVLSFS